VLTEFARRENQSWQRTGRFRILFNEDNGGHGINGGGIPGQEGGGETLPGEGGKAVPPIKDTNTWSGCLGGRSSRKKAYRKKKSAGFLLVAPTVEN